MEDENLISEESVQETPEEEVVQTDASEVEEPIQEEKTEEQMVPQSNVNNIVETRLARERKNHERELNKYRELENIMKTALNAENLDDVITKSKDFYKSNGIEIPEYKPTLDQEDEELLGNGYADKIISTGDYQYMEQEANRIAGIPKEKRSVREDIMFDKLCNVLIEEKQKKELISQGIDTKILDEQDFKEFRKKLNYNIPIKEAVDMYNKMNTTPKEKPYSVGSVKNNVKVNEIKEYYSPEDFDKLTEEDLNNPEIMKAVDRSRLKGFK